MSECTCFEAGRNDMCPTHGSYAGTPPSWVCPSCGQNWPSKPFVADTIGCPECGSIAAPSACVDLTLRCPTCGRRADMCFSHGSEWKKREHHATTSDLHRMTGHELRARVNEFTADDPPPYEAAPVSLPPRGERE